MRSSSYRSPVVVTAFLASTVLGGCVEAPAPGGAELVRGPVAEAVVQAADRHAVPADLMLSIAAIEGGLRLPSVREAHLDDLVVVAGALELRRGKLDTLALGAALSGFSEETLVGDHAAGTEAGAMVLADLASKEGIRRDDLAAWAPVVEAMSGHRTPEKRAEYRARVFQLLRFGGTAKARDRETVTIPAHPEVPMSLTIAPPSPEILGGSPDYEGAEWIDTPCADKCNTSRNAEVTMIAIHDTEGGWDASVATLQNDPGKSVHYIVDADGGRVAQFIPESYNGWHVGNSYYNNRMVGIEHVGFANQDDYATEMYEVSAQLVKDIAARHDIPLDRSHVVAHQEVPDGDNIAQSSPPCDQSPGDCIASGNYGGFGHHHDPGVYWEWCQFMELVGGECKCNDTYELWNCVHDLSMMNRCHEGQVEIVHCADTCVVEPIGTDDHCTEVGETTVSSSAATTSATSAQAATTAVTSGGAGGSDAGGSGGQGDSLDGEGDCDCKIVTRSSAVDARWGLGALVLGGAIAVRRRRRALRR